MLNPEGKQDVDAACSGKDGLDPGSQVLGQLCPTGIGLHGPHAEETHGQIPLFTALKPASQPPCGSPVACELDETLELQGIPALLRTAQHA